MSSLGLLAATALPFVVSPGASFAITVSAAAAGDRRAALKVWFGTALGMVAIATVAGFSGLAQLIEDSDVARLILGTVGGAVLIAIAVASMINAARSAKQSDVPSNSRPRLVLWSFVTVITNVKALSLYVLVVPALSGTGLQGPSLFFTFVAVHAAMQFAWLILVGFTVRAIPGLETSERARTALLLCSSIAIGALGLFTMIETLRSHWTT